MLAVVRTRQAEEDLFGIWSYISVDNPAAADRQLDLFEMKCNLLASSPLLGAACPEFAEDLRMLPMGSYVIFYQVEIDQVLILRVLHGSRDFPAIFSGS